MAEPKRVLITGCSRGIGRAICRQCLEGGWRVTGTARKSDFPKEFSNNPNFSGVHVDFADEQDLRNSLSPLIKQIGFDVLINNAGIFTDSDLLDSDIEWLEVWDRTMAVNVRSAALLSKWFVAHHVKQKTEGTIINIASRAAYRGDTQEYAAYAASKAAMVAFTKSIARDFSRRGVVAYSVAPGFIETDMAKDAVETLGREVITKDSAFDEITQPEEVANLVLFLAERKVAHATGSTFHINGGSYMI